MTRRASVARASFERTGKYDEAIEIYKDLAGKATATVTSRRGLLRVLSEVGKYDEAEEAEAASSSSPATAPSSRTR